MRSVWMLSKAFTKSIKTMLRSDLCSTHCSIKMRIVLIWSVQDDPGACSASIVEYSCFRRSRIIFEIIFATTGSTQIPRQISQSRRLAFFVILTITPSVLSLGKLSFSQASLVDAAILQIAWDLPYKILLVEKRLAVEKRLNDVSYFSGTGASFLIRMF